MSSSFAFIIAIYALAASIRFPGFHVGAILSVGASITFALLAWRTRDNKSVDFNARIFIACAILTASGGAYLNGGVDGYVAPFLIVAPIAAGYFLGLRATLIAGIVTVLVTAGLVILDLNGVVLEAPYETSVVTIRTGFILVAVIGMSTVCVLSYTRHTQRNAERIEEQRALLSAFARSAPIAMAMFDRDIRYIEVSDRWLSDYGLKREDIIGKCHYDIFSDIPQAWKEVHRRCLAGATERSNGDRFGRENGTVHWLFWEVRPWQDRDGKTGGLIIITRDVSEEMRRNEALEEKSAEAERASALKSAFLANISHEIRTPLNGVLGVSQALEDEDLTPDQMAKVRTIRETGEVMLHLLNDVLDLSKVEADRMEMAEEPADPAALVRSVALLFEPGAQEKGLALSVETGTQMPTQVLIDPMRVKQCLSNLVSNAIKFTSEGTVAIKAAYEPENSVLVLTVSDTGMGISDEQRARLFEDYMQADETVAGRFGGTGLGLSLTRRLARLMGGDVSIVRSSDEGSVFELRIHAEETAAGKPAAEKLASERLRWLDGATILLADDVASNRMVAELFLKEHGATVLHAENGQEVLDQLDVMEIDLVLLDLQMPVLDGAQTIARIRSRTGRWASLPVIALTGETGPDMRRDYTAMGLTDFITKPINKTRFLNTVTAALRDADHIKTMDENTVYSLQQA